MANYLQSFFNRDNGEPSGSLFREFERVFDDFSRRSRAALPAWAPGALAPRVDVSEGEDVTEVFAELPGVNEDDIDISVAGGVLTIKGEKKIERDEKGKDWHVVERGYGAFTRSIPLGFEPDPKKVEASFDKGVLSIRLPKPPEAAKKTQKIKINRKGGAAAA